MKPFAYGAGAVLALSAIVIYCIDRYLRNMERKLKTT